MGCSNTKPLPSGMTADSSLTEAMNALNAVDPTDVIEDGKRLLSHGQEVINDIIDEGDKLINQASEALEKSAAAIESVIGKNPFEDSSNPDSFSHELTKISETSIDDSNETKDEVEGPEITSSEEQSTDDTCNTSTQVESSDDSPNEENDTAVSVQEDSGEADSAEADSVEADGTEETTEECKSIDTPESGYKTGEDNADEGEDSAEGEEGEKGEDTNMEMEETENENIGDNSNNDENTISNTETQTDTTEESGEIENETEQCNKTTTINEPLKTVEECSENIDEENVK